MKDHVIKSQYVISILLWIVVTLLVVIGVVVFLESDALLHHEQASGWYVQVLNSINIDSYNLTKLQHVSSL